MRPPGLLKTREHVVIEREPTMIRTIIGIVIGAIGGFVYYKFVGCSTGTCPITSNPIISTIYGAVIGAAASGMFSHG
jgi:hypothetical protein